MPERPTRTVAIDALRTLMERLLEAAGCGPEVAVPVANVFLEANLRGVPTQGLHHLVRVMIPLLRNRRVQPNALPKLAKEGPAFAIVEGNRGPGQLAAIMAADVAVRKAKKAGAAAVGIVNSSDSFMVGFYAERMARAGCVGIGFSDSGPLVHAAGGAGRVFGTNPLFVGIPTAGDHPFVLDMATSAWSAGHVRHAMYHGEPLPPHVAVDRDGRPTRDATVAWMEGALSPFGGAVGSHKGSGLGLFVGFLSGPLVGAATGRALLSWLPDAQGLPDTKGHLMLAVDPAAFGDADAFRRRVSDYLAAIKGSRKAPGARDIAFPGERTFAERERSLRAGSVPVFERIWEQARKVAGELGVAMPE